MCQSLSIWDPLIVDISPNTHRQQIPAFHCSTIYTWVSYSVPDSCLSLLNYWHMGFLLRSRFLPFTAKLFTRGFLDPFQIPAFLCSTIYTQVSYSVPDSCLSLLHCLHMGFLFRSRFRLFTAQLFAHGFLPPFQISAYHCPTIYKWVSWSVPDFWLSLPNYLHIGFLFRSIFLPFIAQQFTHEFLFFFLSLPHNFPGNTFPNSKIHSGLHCLDT